MYEQRLVKLVRMRDWPEIELVWRSEDMVDADVYVATLTSLEAQTGRLWRLVELAAREFNKFESRQDAIELEKDLRRIIHLIEDTTHTILKRRK